METQGQGPDLVLLHGWGLHGGVWESLLPRLAAHFRVTRVDLPGHGLSRTMPMSGVLSEVAGEVLTSVPAHAVWLGWSLGGLIAQRAALDAPRRLRGLILANTTPRFVTAPGWPDAMPPEQLQEFAAGLDQDYKETLQRFLSLQVRGDEAARGALRQLRDALFVRGEPDGASLAIGLELLRKSDLRPELARIASPTLVITGGYDRLTPPGAGVALAHAVPAARLHLIPKSAHAPFLSHAEDFIAAITGFMQGLDTGRPAQRRNLS
ncbi:MAG TPA: pimeloyl-ACP methyl ester esterase BioH [Gammaproteobacteria bacterium]|nr:pimeloyl-ACP methyl ester esterase BioH [Gammaproteobacteria bacterium]